MNAFRKFLLTIVMIVALPLLATNAPSNLNATGISSNQVSLTWTDNSSDEIGFTFMFDTNPAFTNPTYVWAGGANTTSYTHGSRSAATTYYYKIKAEGNPDSGWTSADGATTAPSSLSAAATSNSALSLSWTGNAGNTDVIGYTYAYANNSAFSGATYVWVAGNGATSATRSGLSTATTYWLKIKAEGVVDGLDSPYGSVVTATTTPTNVAATAAGASQINVSWSGNAANANLNGYTVAKATNSGFSNATYHFVYGPNATSYSSTGLTAGTTYYFKVKAEGTSDAYDSPFTAGVSATTSNGAPNPPSNLSATAISSTRIDLTWTDNSTDETGFELKRATDSAFTQNVIWIGGINGTSYSDASLTGSTTYYYKVRAQGAVQDSVYSNAVSATTPASSIPLPPSNLTGTAVSTSRINLSWTDNSNNETGFELKRATDSGFTQNVVWIGNIQGTSYGNVGLNAATTYYYKVRAEGAGGKSTYSNTVSVTTPGTPPVTEGIPISPRFFGQNAWMPQYVGSTFKNGKLEANWTRVQESRARSVRYGGIAVNNTDATFVDGGTDTCPPDLSKQGTKMQYVKIINAMHDIDVTPIIQVGVAGPNWNADRAKALVQCINGTMGLGVKYWVIGNEPDLHSAYTVTQVRDYVRAFSRAMKDADSSIKIVAPETAWFHWSNYIDLLTNGGDHDITGLDPERTNRYFVDVISFHTYPYGNSFPDRNGVIGATTEFKNDLVQLKNRIAQRNATLGRTGDNALQFAVTEANINFDNPSNDNIDGVGGVSFLGGQFWADMLGVAMQQGVDFLNFWSVIEGRYISEDKGYLCNKPAEFGHDWAHPSYHHFKMMAEHVRGNALLPPPSTGQFDNQDNVKTFAAKDTDQVAVILINQDASTDFSYAVSLNGTASSGTLQVNIPANITAAQSTGTLYKQSTLLLVFDNTGTVKTRVEYRRYGPSGTPWLNTTP